MTVTRAIPAGLRELPLDEGLCNLDQSISDGLADKLRAGDVCCRHAGWEFNGIVWYADGQFHEEVSRYHAVQATYSADTLEALMTLVNDVWGYE